MPTFEGGGPGKFRQRIVEQVGELDPDGAPIDERTTLRFVIEKDGSMSGVSVDDKTPVWLIERLEKALDVMPRWTPGMMQGERSAFRSPCRCVSAQKRRLIRLERRMCLF